MFANSAFRRRVKITIRLLIGCLADPSINWEPMSSPSHPLFWLANRQQLYLGKAMNQCSPNFLNVPHARISVRSKTRAAVKKAANLETLCSFINGENTSTTRARKIS